MTQEQLDVAMIGDDIPDDLDVWLDDDMKATRVLRRHGAAKRRIAARTRIRDNERSRLDEWYADVTRADIERVARDELALAGYLARRRQHNPRLATLRLPTGTIAVRGSQSLEVDDPDAVIRWARENGVDGTVLRIEVAKGNLKDQLARGDDGTIQTITYDGMSVPGIRIASKSNYTVTPITHDEDDIW
jgi:hypothetical protein